MLCICLPLQRELSAYHTNTKLDTLCIFGQTESGSVAQSLRVLNDNYKVASSIAHTGHNTLLCP